MEDQKCKKCGSSKIVMVEYSIDNPEYYDGASEIECQDCGARFGRWSGKQLGAGEVERKFGRK